MTPDHLVCYICGLPSTQSRHAGEMCTLCADAFDSNDVKTLINRSAEGTAVHHDAAPGDDSRYCAVCRHEIYRLGTDGWRHN